MPGIIERYRERLPFAPRGPGGLARGGLDPADPGRAAVREGRSRGVAEDRGRQPDRLVQGPGDDLRGVGRRPRGRHGGHLRLDRQHRRLGRRLRRPGRAALRGDRPRGQDRHRQAGPGADARRPGGGAARQLRRGAEARARAGQPPPDLARQLGQRLPDRGAEDRRVRDRRGAGRRARRALHPGRQRRQHHRVLEGLQRGRAAAADAAASRPPARRRSCTASRSSTPRRWPARSGSATRRAGRRR